MRNEVTRKLVIRALWFVFWMIVAFYIVGDCTRELAASNEVKESGGLFEKILPGLILVAFIYTMWRQWKKDTGGFTYWKDKKEREENNG